MESMIFEPPYYKDDQAIYDIRTHPDVDKQLFGPPPKSYDAHMSHMETHYSLFRVLKVNGVIVGYSQYKMKDKLSCEVGFAVHPDHQGKGYGQELVRLTLELGVVKTYPFVVLYVKSENEPAVHIYAKNGFLVAGMNNGIFMMVKSNK